MKTMKEAMLFIAVGTMWCVCSGRCYVLLLPLFCFALIWRASQ